MICICMRRPFFGVFVIRGRTDAVARAVGFVQRVGATISFNDFAGSEY